MIVAQITDAHMTAHGRLLFGDYDPRRALRRTLAALVALRPRPDLVVFTGDLAESGAPEEYASVLAALEGFDLPLAAVPGNHDRRDAFAAAFAGGPVRTGEGAFLHLTIDAGPLRVIALDTLGEPGASRGALCPERLAWTEARLAEAERPTLVFMHHPPFATGIGFMDAIGCVGGEALAALVARHGRVARVACGHVHRSASAGFGGTVGTICPGVAYAAPLLLSSEAPAGPVVLTPQPPAYLLHVWTEAGGLVTHTEHLRDGW